MKPLIATVVAAPGAPAMDDGLAARLAQGLPHADAAIWLARGEAFDIPFGEPVQAASSWPILRAFAGGLRERLGECKADVFVQPAAHRRKKLFLADMDSTMIGQECIDELADFAGVKDHVAAITERAMRGEIAFEPALRERVGLLKGLPVSIVDRVIAERITLTPGGRTLVQTMRAHGANAMLVSGGFTLFTQEIAPRIGFDDHRANRLIVENGAFAGRVEEPILGREAKLAALLEQRAALSLAKDETMAIGDGANDLAMLEEAGLGVAFKAKPAVAAAAHARIDHGDLSALLFAQGYRREEFATV